MAALVIAEHDNQKLRDATARTVAAAAAVSAPIHILVAGDNCSGVAQAAAQIVGVEKVLVADNPLYANRLAETMEALVLSIADPYDAILAAATSTGKNLLPRIAAKLDVPQISEIIKIVSPDTFERPIYAGNAIQTVQAPEGKKVITVRTSVFQPAGDGGGATIENLGPAADPGLSKFQGEVLSKSDRPELAAAKIVISGGRGLGSAENFALVNKVAARLNAAVGASRAAVDAGYVPNDYQVGQTGKIVAPDLYMAIGISGAIQHLAGMKDSRVIVAINKDEEAPIFQIADYGLVSDLFEALPEMDKELAKLGY